MLTNNWCYFVFVIVAAVSGGGDAWCYNLLSLSYPRVFFKIKKTACSIMVAYLGQFSAQFTEFRVFKVLFRLTFRLLMLLLSSFPSTGCGHLRYYIRNARRHHDYQHYGVVFVSSLQPITGSKMLYIDPGFFHALQGCVFINFNIDVDHDVDCKLTSLHKLANT